MRKTTTGKLLLLVAVLMIFGSCAGRHQVQAQATGPKTVTMKADSYEFEPDDIKANLGDTITFTITNVSKNEHNFTIKDPEGKIMQSVDLHPQQTSSVTVTFPQKGRYGFYCNKTFHPTMGMRGRVEIE